MTAQTKPLRQSDYVANAEADLFVATNTTIIDKCASSAIAAGIVTLRIVQAAGTPGNQHQQAKKTFAVDEAYTWPEIVGQTLGAGDKIRGVCSVASAVTLRLSGREIT